MEADRKWEEDNHLVLSADVSDVCGDEDIGFGMEQPHWAASWSTRALNNMNENLVVVYNDPNGQVIEKTTRIRTGSNYLFQALDLTCKHHQAEHVQMDGKSKALKATQNYKLGFVKRAADAIV